MISSSPAKFQVPLAATNARGPSAAAAAASAQPRAMRPRSTNRCIRRSSHCPRTRRSIQARRSRNSSKIGDITGRIGGNPWKPHGKRRNLNDSVIMTNLWYHIDIGNPIIGIYESLVMRIKNRHIIIYWPLGDISDLEPPLNEWRLARYDDDGENSATIEIWLGISSLCCFATYLAVLMMP